MINGRKASGGALKNNYCEVMENGVQRELQGANNTIRKRRNIYEDYYENERKN